MVEVCSQHLHQQPQSLAARGIAISAELDAVVLACLEKDPKRRPQTANELRARVEACHVKPWDRDAARNWWRDYPVDPDADAELPTGDAHTIAVDGVHR